MLPQTDSRFDFASAVIPSGTETSQSALHPYLKGTGMPLYKTATAMVRSASNPARILVEAEQRSTHRHSSFRMASSGVSLVR